MGKQASPAAQGQPSRLQLLEALMRAYDDQEGALEHVRQVLAQAGYLTATQCSDWARLQAEQARQGLPGAAALGDGVQLGVAPAVECVFADVQMLPRAPLGERIGVYLQAVHLDALGLLQLAMRSGLGEPFVIGVGHVIGVPKELPQAGVVLPPVPGDA